MKSVHEEALRRAAAVHPLHLDPTGPTQPSTGDLHCPVQGCGMNPIKGAQSHFDWELLLGPQAEAPLALFTPLPRWSPAKTFRSDQSHWKRGANIWLWQQYQCGQPRQQSTTKGKKKAAVEFRSDRDKEY